MLTDGLGKKEREQFDTELHGWSDDNERGNLMLRAAPADESGGEG